MQQRVSNTRRNETPPANQNQPTGRHATGSGSQALSQVLYIRYSPLPRLAQLEAAGPLLPQVLDEREVGCVVARKILHRTLQESEAFGIGHQCSSTIAAAAATGTITFYLHLIYFAVGAGCMWGAVCAGRQSRDHELTAVSVVVGTRGVSRDQWHFSFVRSRAGKHNRAANSEQRSRLLLCWLCCCRVVHSSPDTCLLCTLEPLSLSRTDGTHCCEVSGIRAGGGFLNEIHSGLSG